MGSTVVDSPRCVTKCVNTRVSIVSNADNAFWEAIFVLSSIIRDKEQEDSGRKAHFVVLRPTTHDGDQEGKCSGSRAALVLISGSQHRHTTLETIEIPLT